MTRYVTIDVTCVDARGHTLLHELVRAPTEQRARRKAKWLVEEAEKLGKVARTKSRRVKDQA